MNEILSILRRDYHFVDDELLVECINDTISNLGIKKSQKKKILSSNSFVDQFIKQSPHFEVDEYDTKEGKVIETAFWGKFHSIGDEPAVIIFDRAGEITRKEWYNYKIKGPVRMSGKPSIEIYKNGVISSSVWTDSEGNKIDEKSYERGVKTTNEHLYTTKENLKHTLEKYGVAIIPSVLNKTECESMISGFWDFLENATKSFDVPIKRSDPTSWKSFWELYPKHGMLLQQWGIGHAQFLWDVRQNKKVIDIFRVLWGTDDLLVSFDGASFGFPPEVTRRGHFKGNTWYHFDQRLSDSSLRSVQSWVTALDVNKGDATLSVVQGSHKYHSEFARKFDLQNQKADWYRLTPEQMDWVLEKERTKKIDITCRAGDIVLWDSRTIHMGKEPLKTRNNQNFRCVAYLCYTPREWATESDLKKKRLAFKNLRTTTHLPHKPKLFPLKPRTYGAPLPDISDVNPPEVSDIGKKLAGF